MRTDASFMEHARGEGGGGVHQGIIFLFFWFTQLTCLNISPHLSMKLLVCCAPCFDALCAEPVKETCPSVCLKQAWSFWSKHLGCLMSTSPGWGESCPGGVEQAERPAEGPQQGHHCCSHWAAGPAEGVKQHAAEGAGAAAQGHQGTERFTGCCQTGNQQGWRWSTGAVGRWKKQCWYLIGNMSVFSWKSNFFDSSRCHCLHLLSY